METLCGPTIGCQKFLTPEERPPDPAFGSRVRFLTRLESLINLGCKLQVNDLDPQTWTELYFLALERQRMERRVDQQRDRQSKATRTDPVVAVVPPEQQKLIQRERKALGVPAPGESAFPRKKPMR